MNPPTQTAIAQDRPAPSANAQLANPFTKAAREHVEPIFDVSGVPGAGARQMGNGILEVPAYGYLRHLLFLIEATGGAKGAATVAVRADAPWSVIDSIALTDVNGQFIFGPYTGYEWFLVNLFGGGPAHDPDPRNSGTFSDVDVDGNFKFLLRLPVEITHQDGLGALANLNSSSTYKVQLTLAGSDAVYSTPPATTIPTVRVRGFLEAWTQPNDVDAFGTPNIKIPPALGTVQNWSKEDKAIAAGSQTPRLSRVGNAIRTIILVTKNAAGQRISTMAPAQFSLDWDGRQLQTMPPELLRHYMSERYGIPSAKLPTGVYVFEFTHDFDGKPGGESRNGYLNTTQASRLELKGVYGAAGVMTVLTNDVLAFADAAL